MTIGVRQRALLSALAVLAASIPLLWACFAQVLADRAMKRGPEAALAWTRGDPGLLASLAQLRADDATTEAQLAAADRLARRSLVQAPLENRALLVLALNADRRGRREQAGELMTVLGERTLRDTQVQLWLAERALDRRNYGEAFTRLDVALRRDPDLAEVAFPVMAQALGDPAAATPLTARLAARPPWREAFISELTKGEAGPSHTAILLAGLRKTPAPASDAEAGALMTAMLSQGDYRGARATWLRLLPSAAAAQNARLYDGTFSGRAGAPPFNWRLRQGSAVVSERAQAPDGRPALHVRYSVARRQVLAEQLVALAPGSYRLTGEALIEDGETPDELAWSLSCAGAARTVLGETLLRRQGPGWRSFSVTFEVAANGCDAQWLRLANEPQDSFATAEAWFATLAIQPEAARPSL